MKLKDIFSSTFFISWLLIVFGLLSISFQQLPSNNESTEIRFYDVIMRKKVVGEFETTKRTKDDLVVYKNCADIEINLVKEILVSYRIESTFQDGYMLSSNATIYLNDDIYKQTKTTRTGNKYRIAQENKRVKWLEEQIPYSSVMLMFEEPEDIEKTFSEQAGEMHSITLLNDHVYQKNNGRRSKDEYHYKKGLLEYAEVDAGIIKFKLRLKNTIP